MSTPTPIVAPPSASGGGRGWRGGKSPPDISALTQYNPNRAGAVEAIWQPFYDFQTYAQAGTTQMSFFQVQNGASGKTYADTNMTNQGVFPAPTMFFCVGIQVVFIPGGTSSQVGTAAARALNNLNDTVVVSNSGWLEMSIGSKVYLRDAPIGKFAPNFTVQFYGMMNGAGNTGSGDAQYARAAGRYYDITPFTIPTQQNFLVTLNWPTAQAASVAGRIGVILDGFYYRQSQ